MRLPQDEMLPPGHMRELFELHGRDPWTVVYFEGERVAACRLLAASCCWLAQWVCGG